MNVLLDNLERLIRQGDAQTILAASTEGGSRAMAEQVLASDEQARLDFDGSDEAIAAYLRTLAVPQRRDAERALAEPDRAPKWPMTATAELHVATVEARTEAARIEANRPPVAVPADPAAPAPSVALAVAHDTEELDEGAALALLRLPTVKLGRSLLARIEHRETESGPLWSRAKIAALAGDRPRLAAVLTHAADPSSCFIESGCVAAFT